MKHEKIDFSGPPEPVLSTMKNDIKINFLYVMENEKIFIVMKL